MSIITKSTLDTGVKLITEEMADSESTCIGLWVNTGSRYETADIGGVSHFIEHMLFKGTANRTAHDISREIESVGGVLNAFTGREYTCFYAKVLNKDVGRAVRILSDMFRNSLFSTREMKKEKMVVGQEIKMVQDTPDDLIHDVFAERFFNGHPLGRSILGTTETLNAITRRSLMKYFDCHYRTNGVFVASAGGVSHEKIAKLLKRTFDPLQGDFFDVEEPVLAEGPALKLVEKDLEQAHLCLGVPVPPQAHPHRYRLYLLNTILGSGMSSRLFQKIREKRGLVYSVYSYLNLYLDAGAMVVYAGTTGENFKKVIELVMKEFSSIAKNITAEELREAKSHLKGSLLLGLEGSDSRMAKLAKDELYLGGVVPIKKVVRSIDRVSVKDVKDAAAKYLRPEKMTLAAIGKGLEGELPPSFAKLLT
jgi:predicted Zn-dependent peptidase